MDYKHSAGAGSLPLTGGQLPVPEAVGLPRKPEQPVHNRVWFQAGNTVVVADKHWSNRRWCCRCNTTRIVARVGEIVVGDIGSGGNTKNNTMMIGLGMDRRNIGPAIGNHMLLVLVVARNLDIVGRQRRRKWIRPGLVVVELGALGTGFGAVAFVAVGLLLEMRNPSELGVKFRLFWG